MRSSPRRRSSPRAPESRCSSRPRCWIPTAFWQPATRQYSPSRARRLRRISWGPYNGGSGSARSRCRLDVEFHAPVEPSALDGRVGLHYRGIAVQGAPSAPDERTIRFVPAYVIAPDADEPCELRLSGAIRALDGHRFRGQSFHFRVSNERPETPAVSAVKIGPAEGRIESTTPIIRAPRTTDPTAWKTLPAWPLPSASASRRTTARSCFTPLSLGAAGVAIDDVEGPSGDWFGCPSADRYFCKKKWPTNMASIPDE